MTIRSARGDTDIENEVKIEASFRLRSAFVSISLPLLDTRDKFITCVVVTGDNCSPVSLILGKMSPVFLSPADHCSPVSLILVINLSLVLLSPAIIVQRCQRHR